jgi:hypothetical protein
MRAATRHAEVCKDLTSLVGRVNKRDDDGNDVEWKRKEEREKKIK